MKFKRRKWSAKKTPLGNRKQKIRRLKWIFGVIFSILLIFLLCWSLRLSQFQISNIEISGAHVIPESKISNIVEGNLSGTYFLVSPKRNIFFYPENKIVEQIEGEFKRVEMATVKFVNLTTIEVKIVERKPDSMWCGIRRDIKISGGCYFMDKNGYIYAKSPDFTGNVFFEFYGLDMNEYLKNGGNPIGVEFMSKERFGGFKLFSDSLIGLGYTPISLRSIDEDLELYFEDGFKIIFGEDQNLATILDNFQSVIDSNELPKNKSIDYLDLRFGNKVYYKFNEGYLE